MGYDSKTRYEALASIRNGATLRQAANSVGIAFETVRRWCKAEGIHFSRGSMGGAILPSSPPSRYKSGRLNLVQRQAIGIGLAAGATHAQIALGIGFSRSTVSREIARHRKPDGTYDPYLAQM